LLRRFPPLDYVVSTNRTEHHVLLVPCEGYA